MTEKPTELKPGDIVSDGTLFAGVSPDTGGAMYILPFDSTTKHGHKDWRPPTKTELNVLFNNHAALAKCGDVAKALVRAPSGASAHDPSTYCYPVI
jgi:hypothetical protein